MAMTNSDITDEDRPIPPRDGASARYPGTQLFKPHQPNSVQAFISVMTTVTFAIGGTNSMLTRARSDGGGSSQIFGSRTFCWIHIVNSAGMTPTKKTPRQPHSGITSRLTSAASPYPIAHEL